MKVIREKVFIGTRSCEDKIKQFKRKELERRFSYRSRSDNVRMECPGMAR